VGTRAQRYMQGATLSLLPVLQWPGTGVTTDHIKACLWPPPDAAEQAQSKAAALQCLQELWGCPCSTSGCRWREAKGCPGLGEARAYSGLPKGAQSGKCFPSGVLVCSSKG